MHLSCLTLRVPVTDSNRLTPLSGRVRSGSAPSPMMVCFGKTMRLTLVRLDHFPLNPMHRSSETSSNRHGSPSHGRHGPCETYRAPRPNCRGNQPLPLLDSSTDDGSSLANRIDDLCYTTQRRVHSAFCGSTGRTNRSCYRSTASVEGQCVVYVLLTWQSRGMSTLVLSIGIQPLLGVFFMDSPTGSGWSFG